MKFSKKNIFLILMFGLIAILVFMSTRETKKYVKDGKKEQPDFAYESLLKDNDGIIVL